MRCKVSRNGIQCVNDAVAGYEYCGGVCDFARGYADSPAPAPGPYSGTGTPATDAPAIERVLTYVDTAGNKHEVTPADNVAAEGGPPRVHVSRPIPAFNPRDSATRKGQPIATGVLAYWPKTMAALSEVSRRGNDKHNPGEPLHWARDKSTDEADSCVRHIVDALTDPGGVLALNEDGSPHLLAALWRLASWCERALDNDDRWRTVAKKAGQ